MSVYRYDGTKIIDPPSLSVPWSSEMHRGYTSATVAENTLAAFHRAFLNGANSIEVDARLSSDNQYVCCHDASITVGGASYTIANTPASTLTNLVLSTDSVYGECKMPLLLDVLKLCCYTGMFANVDCKAINPTTIAQLVVNSGMSGRVVYANTSISNVNTILAVDPNACFSFMYSSANITAWNTTLQNLPLVKAKSFVWYSSISSEIVETTHANGYSFMLTEVSTTDNMYYAPDMIEFVSTADCKALNQTYLDTLDLGV